MSVMTNRQTKITFGDMREQGVRGILVYCSDYRCSHWTRLDADRWPDEARLSDVEPGFVCTACARRGPDVLPNWQNVESEFPALVTM